MLSQNVKSIPTNLSDLIACSSLSPRSRREPHHDFPGPCRCSLTGLPQDYESGAPVMSSRHVGYRKRHRHTGINAAHHLPSPAWPSRRSLVDDLLNGIRVLCSLQISIAAHGQQKIDGRCEAACVPETMQTRGPISTNRPTSMRLSPPTMRTSYPMNVSSPIVTWQLPEICCRRYDAARTRDLVSSDPVEKRLHG
jgi:hypothetical protein